MPKSYTQFKIYWKYIAFCIILLTFHGESWAEQLKIGVLAKRGAEMAHQKWDATAVYLTNHLKDQEFIITPLDFEDIQLAVVQNRIDFLLANPSIYVEMEVKYGVSRLVTLKNKGPVEAHTAFGGVIITKKDRNDIDTIKDLKKGYSFMAVQETSLGGFQLAWNELKKVGVDPYKDFTELLFRGKHDLVVYAVLNGEVDVGTVRTDTLERMSEEGSINLNDFKIIGAKFSNDFPYQHSTILVPEWPLAKLTHIPDNLAQQVAIALMEMPVDSEAAIKGKNEGWTVPLNYQPIRNLLINLHIGPFRKYGQLTFYKLIYQYWPMILASFVIFLLLITALYYILQTNRKLNRSHNKLSKEIEDRLQIEQRLNDSYAVLKQQIAQYEATLERLKRIEKYHELTSLLITYLKPKKLLQEAINQIVELSDSLIGAVYSYDKETKLLEPSVFHGIDENALKSIVLSNSLPNQALKERKIKRYNIAAGDVKIKVQTGLGEILCQEILILPLHAKDLPLGVIVLGSLSDFPVEDLPFFGHMADQISVLLDNALVVQKLDERTHELHEKNESLVLLNQEKNEFLGIAAHDLKNPLSAIKGYAEEIEEYYTEMPKEELIQISCLIKKSSTNMFNLITKLLDVNQIESGEIKLDLVNADILPIVQNIIKTYAKRTQEKNINLHFNQEGKDFYTYVDINTVGQILDNIVSNAIKYSPLGKNIYINLIENPEKIHCEVKDEGQGLSAEDQTKLFGKFNRLSTKPTGGEHSTGLGLFIVKKLVEAMDAKIWCNSELNKGSTFTVEFKKISSLESV